MCLSPLRGLGRWGTFLVLLVPLGFTGCSSSGTVSGKVSYKGTPLKGGSVTFISSPGKPSASTQINEDGSYTVAQVPAGAVKICVDTQMLNPAGKAKAPKYSPPPGMQSPYPVSGDTADPGKRYMPIPADYADPEKTTLTLTVKGGRQDFNIDLK